MLQMAKTLAALRTAERKHRASERKRHALQDRLGAIEQRAVKGYDHDDRGDDPLFQRIRAQASSRASTIEKGEVWKELSAARKALKAPDGLPGAARPARVYYERLRDLVDAVDALPFKDHCLDTYLRSDAVSPHSDPADCPAWYDWCHCTEAHLLSITDSLMDLHRERDAIRKAVHAPSPEDGVMAAEKVSTLEAIETFANDKKAKLSRARVEIEALKMQGYREGWTARETDYRYDGHEVYVQWETDAADWAKVWSACALDGDGNDLWVETFETWLKAVEAAEAWAQREGE